MLTAPPSLTSFIKECCEQFSRGRCRSAGAGHNLLLEIGEVVSRRGCGPEMLEQAVGYFGP